MDPRALPNITSGPEIWQILKVRAVRKPDVFLTGPDTLISRKNIQKNPKKKNYFGFFPQILQFFTYFVYEHFLRQICVLGTYLMRTDISCKIFKKYKSGFSPVRQDLSSKFGCPVLSSQETLMPSPVEPYFSGI